MNDVKTMDVKVKFGLKSFLTICFILLAVMICVGILTYIVPAGKYDSNLEFHFLESSSRLPFYRWFTAPIESLFLGDFDITFQIIQIILILLILGGTFKILDETGCLYSVVRIVVNKFYKHRYFLIWIVTLIMMLLASLFGLQEELLVLFPLFIMFAKAMGWSKVTAISLILLTTGVGYTAAIFNPFSIGAASELANTNVLDAVWYRLIIFAVLYFFTSLYLLYKVKREEKNGKYAVEGYNFEKLSEEELTQDKQKSKMVLSLFISVLAIIILSSSIPFLSDLGITMILMASAFIIGTFIIGSKQMGGFKNMIKPFWKGVIDIAPSIIVILLAFSVKYIADCGNILDTLFYYFYNMITSTSPYIAVTIMYVFVLLIEFFIPSSTAKVFLLIPLLTLVPIPHISKNIILLVFLFGDGYTNVLYPTCGTLVIGLSLAEVNYGEWFKKTILFQILLFIVSLSFILFAVLIGL